MTIELAQLADLVRVAVGSGRCVVALGGGADSAVLLAAAAKADLLGTRGVFVNHHLEGSPVLRESAEALAEHLGVAVEVIDAPTPDGPDLEARARDIRYHALESLLAPDEVCCTGHTLDDQAETVLMRLARGSGATGLSGIPGQRGPLRRPFLGVARADLRQIAIDRDLPFADDPANSDERFLRSTVRQDVVPTLERVFGSGIQQQLASSAGLIAADDALLSWMSRMVPVRTVNEAGQVSASIPAYPLAAAPGPVAARVVRAALASFHDPYQGSASDVAAVRAVATDGSQRVLKTDIICDRELGEVVLYRGTSEQPPPPQPIAVPAGGHLEIEWGDHRYRVSRSDRPALLTTDGRRTAVAVPDGATVEVRAVTDGDRIDIDAGTTPVSEVLRAAGVPARRRPFWMAVTINGKIGAVHGIKVAPWARPKLGEQAVVIEREGSL